MFIEIYPEQAPLHFISINRYRIPNSFPFLYLHFTPFFSLSLYMYCLTPQTTRSRLYCNDWECHYTYIPTLLLTYHSTLVVSNYTRSVYNNAVAFTATTEIVSNYNNVDIRISYVRWQDNLRKVFLLLRRAFSGCTKIGTLDWAGWLANRTRDPNVRMGNLKPGSPRKSSASGQVSFW